jgi:hypothetical protein
MLNLGLLSPISFNVRFFFENMPTFNSKYGIFKMLHLLQNIQYMAQDHSLIDSHNSCNKKIECF